MEIPQPKHDREALNLYPALGAIAIVFFAVVVISTRKFGRAFLVQFFLNPFQMFIALPWALVVFCVWKGFMPLKRGGRVERATNPVRFWIGVGFYASVGTMFFILNLWLSWTILSRSR